MDNMIGAMLDNRYELLEIIGSGGMSIVYKAKCHRLNRLVAVKLLRSDLAGDADFRRRFHDESQAVAMLSHPNIVSVYDVSHGAIEYIVMELIDGITLKQYMERRGQLNWREALHFINEIMKGLSHAHSRGIIHRDIKPHNIMVLRDGSIKVADFGIACLSSAAQPSEETFGSVHYISPEQARGDRIDARADIYSAGVVFYEMLTNRLPFEGDSPMAVAIQHLSSVPLSPREINPEVPEALELICMKAMAPDADKRYASADAMREDLEAFRKDPDTALDFTIDDLQRRDSGEDTRFIPRMPGGAVRIEEDDEPEDGEGHNTPRALFITGVAALFIVLICVLWRVVWAEFDTEPVQTEFKVPSLVGMTMEQARADSRVDGIFLIEQIGARSDSNYQEGQIIEQSPSSGSTVKSGSVISVFLSTGVKTDIMPSLIGKEYRAATLLLRQLALDLDIEQTEEESASIGAGTVLRTTPDAGETLTYGDTVTLVVSSGIERKPVTVTPLTNQSLESAQKMITGLGLVCGNIRYANSDSVPAGYVMEQSIAPYTEVNEGTTVNLLVSLGPLETAAEEEEPPAEPEPESGKEEEGAAEDPPASETPETDGEPEEAGEP